MRDPATGRFVRAYQEGAPAGAAIIIRPSGPDAEGGGLASSPVVPGGPPRRNIRAIDVLCGALSALLATGQWALVTWTWDNSTAAAVAEQARAKEGVHADAPAPPPAPPPGPADVEADVEAVWLAEMRRAGVPRRLLARYHGQITAESRWDPAATSPVGARGLAQAMPRTAAQEFPRLDPSCAGVSPYDPACSARFQAAYRGQIRRWLPGDASTPELELAAYNAGIGRVKSRIAECRATPQCDPRAWETIAPRMPRETRRYVRAIGRYGREAGAQFGGEFEWAF